MKIRWLKIASFWLPMIFVLAAAGVSAAEARMEVIQFESRVLKNNPLHDPISRPIPVFLPAQATNRARLPVIYYLPGYGGSAAKNIQNSNLWLKLTQKIADEITPMIVVIGDGKTRWGGSQYLNSAAQGNYEDYICDEIVPKIEAEHPVPTNGVRRIIAGHSSGGFGALRLGSSHQKLFDAVVALSPDSDFAISHLHLTMKPAVTNTPLAEIKKMAAGISPMPINSSLNYLFGLSAAYAPRSVFHWGEFEWLFDAHGNFRERVWQRWMENDPLTIVSNNPHAFTARQLVYLDGASQDEYRANIGARKIFDVLQKRSVHSAFYEPPGHHSDKIPQRFERGLQWVFNRPLTDVTNNFTNQPTGK
jgi:enterochelin esterase family protein